MSQLEHGVVKWFNNAKGFGFIEHSSGQDVFVHFSVIEQEGFKTLKDGEEVEYELKQGEKGLHAARVVRNISAEELAAAQKAKQIPAELTAPNLEQGTVNVQVQSAASMIEVTRTPANSIDIQTGISSELPVGSISKSGN